MILKAVDKVYKIIKDNYADKWTDTMEIAEKADLSRSVISIYLSQLYKKGKLTKKKWKARFVEVITKKYPIF